MPIPAFSFLSESNERYTPREIIEPATRVLGSIDLDPASCQKANQIVRAGRYFATKDNGLSKTWKAKTIWLNPPYGKTHNQSNAGIWLAKAINEYQTGHFEAGIILVNACVGANWFRPAYDYLICFFNGRIPFLDSDLKPLTQPTKDNALIYFGPHCDRFVAEFSEIGTCITRLSPVAIPPCHRLI